MKPWPIAWRLDIGHLVVRLRLDHEGMSASALVEHDQPDQPTPRLEAGSATGAPDYGFAPSDPTPRWTPLGREWTTDP